jgi:meso-butanediol dehydrogenase / (S,S)-butanediol dehydrogenase / diacetyl reductase
MSFAGKVVMITGAGGGIGRGVARAFADEGAIVFATDVNETKVKQTERELKEIGSICVSQKVDVRSQVEVVGSLGHCLEEFGRVDILVNCAGILSLDRYDEITQELWDNIMAVNARGTFFACQAVAREMVRRGEGGKIVNISSVAGKVGGVLYTHYCSSKFAVIGMTKCLALELADHKINVNAVCPGDVDTEMSDYEFATLAKIRGISEDEVRKQAAKRAPLGRLALPSDVANVVLFLASEKSSYMTGQSLNVTGGTMTF